MTKHSTVKNKVPQPLFFKDPVPLMKDKHAEAGLKNNASYAFSKNTNSTPITIREFSEVCKVYPIVFSDNKVNDAFAVMGIQNAKNLFTGSDGKWIKNTYIPAYLRKYPFAFLADGKGKEEKLILCVDQASERFVKKAKRNDIRFFEGGAETASTKKALEYCLQFHRDSITTQAFIKAIRDAGLLTAKQVTATFKGKEKPFSLSGFSVIDEAKLAKLDANKINEWHKNGYLLLIYMHLISLSNFNRLTSLMK